MPAKKNEKAKACANPQCPQAGEIQSADMFYWGQNWCKPCFNKKTSERIKAKAKKEAEARSAAQPAMAAANRRIAILEQDLRESRLVVSLMRKERELEEAERHCADLRKEVERLREQVGGVAA